MSRNLNRQAIRRLSAWCRRVRGQPTTFRTGNGRKNTVTEIDDDSIHLKTSKGTTRIARQKIVEAIRYIYFRRTVTRKEMERYHAFSSAMLGLVSTILVGTTKITRTVTGLLRLTMLGIRYFFSGCERDPTAMRIIKENGGQMVLMSFAQLRGDPKGKWLEYLKETGFIDDAASEEEQRVVLIDCGVITEVNAKAAGKPFEKVDPEEYAQFIEKYRRYIWGFMNLDVIDDPKTTRENYETLTKRLGERPIPVWHINSTQDVLEQIIAEDHDLIAIGGVALEVQNSQIGKVRTRLEQVARRFPDQNFHLLGCAIYQVLTEFMPMSADSKSPVYVGGYGKEITRKRQSEVNKTKAECTAASAKLMAGLEYYYRSGTQYRQLALPI